MSFHRLTAFSQDLVYTCNDSSSNPIDLHSIPLELLGAVAAQPLDT